MPIVLTNQGGHLNVTVVKLVLDQRETDKYDWEGVFKLFSAPNMNTSLVQPWNCTQ